ncbi:hypothetical protein KJ657_03525 [Patescibacteria group bacterium]|nr:hypothetical protein [Patescibacteria group bacterium]MBU1016135.1 hypothetical protein [Patescibacteria group bacterium]MBU1685293.1 hypothetical protein [Patescibacteria group bacterium]MBU1938346.1 hypothetical protein [Patescibacteria group bacterium]
MSLDGLGRNYRATEIGNRETVQESAKNTRNNVSFIVRGGIPAFYTSFLARNGIENPQSEVLGNDLYMVSASSTRSRLLKALKSQKGVEIISDGLRDCKVEEYEGDAEITEQVA